MKAGWLAALMVMIAGTALAADPVFDQPLVEGSLVTGHVTPGSRLSVNGHKVRVFDDGRFVFGLHRDTPEHVMVELIEPNQTPRQMNLAVAQREYDIQRIDGLPPTQVTPPKDVLERISREAKAVAAARGQDTAQRGFEGPWIWPTEGRISGVFGSQRILNGEARQPHYGVDVAGPVGQVIVAPTDGVVSFADRDLYFSGGTLMIDHGAGVASAFLHLSDILVKPGDVVKRGQPVAKLGATGRVTGPHLDWRINWFDARVDAQLLVPPMPGQ